jgi:hypothetical protein
MLIVILCVVNRAALLTQHARVKLVCKAFVKLATMQLLDNTVMLLLALVTLTAYLLLVLEALASLAIMLIKALTVIK